MWEFTGTRLLVGPDIVDFVVVVVWVGGWNCNNTVECLRITLDYIYIERVLLQFS